MNTWQVVKYGIELTLDGYRQLAFINRFLKPLVKTCCDKTGLKLSASQRKKLLFYYPMYTVLACAQMYIALKGRRLTKAETKRLTLIGALATLCDDLTDEDHWTKEELFVLLFEATEEEALSAKAKLVLELNKELQHLWPLPDKYVTQLKIAIEWNTQAEKQLNPDITLAEIVQVSREKNGHTSLLFAAALDIEWTKEELDFIYQSAIVGQMTNDSFDVYADTQNGFFTYFNKAPSMQEARRFFISECKKLHDLVRQCVATEKNKKKTIRRMSILHAFTITAIDHLQLAENKAGLPIDWKSIPRKEMVTDMAKNSNRLKTVRYMKWLSEL